MNFANIENSARLQRVAQILNDKCWHSTMDIIERARVCAVNSIIAELRSNGFDIACKREKKIWFYKLV